MAVIEIRGLTKRFGGLTAVDDVSFTVGQGSVVGFLGPNGAGRTTTLRMPLGLVAPTAGTALINGRLYRQLTHPRHVVGAVLESSGAYPGRTARNHLRIEALAGGANSSRVGEVLDQVDLAGAADRRVGQFSLGVRQRLGLATALLSGPDQLEVTGATGEQIGTLAAAEGIPLFETAAETAGLEDVFLKLTAEGTPSSKASR